MSNTKNLKLFYNANFYTFEIGQKNVEAILVQNGQIIYCGKSSDINLPDYLVDKIDLKNQYVIPAFTDCHTHVAAVALDHERLRLDDCESKGQALNLISNFVNTVKAGQWILGGGWNANIWPEGLPNRNDLDSITKQNPIALYNKDGHTQWLNSLAMTQCGFVKDSTDPRGGRLARDEKGNLTGLVYEKACEWVDRISDICSYDQLQRCMNILYPILYRLGITGVHSCDGFDKFKLFQQMQINNDLKLRVCMHPPAADMDKLIDVGILSAGGNEWLRLGGLKYFADGSLGSQTADMFENYEGLDHSGISVLSEADLHEQVRHAAENGLSATIHAIGDKAIYKTLNVFEAIKNIKSPVPLRHRIEHSQIIREQDLPRFSSLNIIASMQPLHIADDVKIAEKYLGERSKYTYPVNSLLKSGCRVVFGSDMPVADPDPLKGIQAAMSRRYLLDKSQAKWQPQECINVHEAVHAYTRDAAYASYEESTKGTLAPGKVADFIVLNQDILDSNEKKIDQIKNMMTIMGGEIVYCGN
jgi:predicted amidohydrolase YtcJ